MTAPLDAAAAAPGPPARPVTGIVLRYALVVALHDHGRPLTVRQLCAILDRQRLAPSGRASKAVSDALRWEVDRGRVRRTARATYAIGQVARADDLAHAPPRGTPRGRPPDGVIVAER